MCLDHILFIFGIPIGDRGRVLMSIGLPVFVLSSLIGYLHGISAYRYQECNFKQYKTAKDNLMNDHALNINKESSTKRESNGGISSSLLKKIAVFIPGIMLIGYNIGTGSITSMAKAGANYGVSLLWTLAISCFITYFLIRIYGRYTTVTGERALTAFKKHLHPSVAMFFLIGIVTATCGSIMGVMGIVVDVLYVWSQSFITGGISALSWAVAGVIVINAVLWTNKGTLVDKVLSGLVALMALAFIINFFLMMPPVADMLNGFIPSIPVATDSSISPMLVIASMVGTTVAPAMFLMRTTLVKNAKWTVENLKEQNLDAIVSTTLMFIISAAVMAAAAATLFKQGLTLENTSDMIEMLRPLAGPGAVLIFVIGIAAAGFSSQFPNIAIAPWFISDIKNNDNGLTHKPYLWIMTGLSLLCLVVPIFDARPVFIMIASQAFNAVILPGTVLAMFYLANQTSLMGKYKCKPWENAVFALVSLFTLGMGFLAMKSLIESFM